MPPESTIDRAKIIGVRHTRNMPLDARAIDKEKRTVPILFSAGTPVTRAWGVEILSMAPGAVRMGSWMSKAPFLMDHNIRDQRGVIENGTLEGGQLRGDARLSRSERGEELFQDIVDGIRTQVSVGYDVYNYHQLKPEEMSPDVKEICLRNGIPAYMADDWEPFEGSSVWLGADTASGVGRSAQDAIPLDNSSSTSSIQLQQTREGARTMPPTDEEIQKQQRAAVEAERNRIAEIDATAREYKSVEGIDALRASAVTEGHSADAFAGNVLRLMADNRRELTAIQKEFDGVAGISEIANRAAQENWTPKKFREEAMKALRGKSPAIATAEPSAANTDKAPLITNLRDLVPHWQRRAVVGLSMEVARDRGNVGKAKLLRTRLSELEKEVTPQMQDAETREVLQMIEKSGLPQLQQYRLMSALSGAAGGFLNPTPMLAEIFILVERWGVARRYFRPITMVADTLKLDSLVTEAIAYWVNVGGGITASDLVFGQGSLTVYKLAGISSWVSETDEDAAIALLPIYIDSIARAIRKKEDLAGFIGDGTATYGSFTGLLASAGNVYTLDAGKTSIYDASPDDWKGLRDKLNIDFRDGAYFFIPPELVSSLEGAKDLQGRYVYREPAAGMPAQLWGYPIADSVGINALSRTDAAALKFAAFGNPRHMLMGMKREIETVVSQEGILDDGSGNVVFNALQADGSIVRTTERIGFKCVLTGGLAVMKTAAV